jgi:hypothetical protein
MLTIQERFEVADGDLHKALDRLCRAIGSEAAEPAETQLDALVRQIESCTATAGTLAAPPVVKAKPAAKRTRRR